MATVRHACGAQPASVGTGIKGVSDEFNKLQADYVALRTAFLALTAKLDLDATIAATDFAATCNPAAATSAAITVE